MNNGDVFCKGCKFRLSDIDGYADDRCELRYEESQNYFSKSTLHKRCEVVNKYNNCELRQPNFWERIKLYIKQ